jgi:hypothetical protein
VKDIEGDVRKHYAVVEIKDVFNKFAPVLEDK